MRERPDFELSEIVFEEDAGISEEKKSERRIITKEISFESIRPLVERKINGIMEYMLEKEKIRTCEEKPEPGPVPKAAGSDTTLLYVPQQTQGGYMLTERRSGRQIPVDGTIRIGREPSFADMCFEDNMNISKKHAKVSETGLSVEDLGSSNGTFVNGKRIQPGGPVRITEGDIIKFANIEVLVERM